MTKWRWTVGALAVLGLASFDAMLAFPVLLPLLIWVAHGATGTGKIALAALTGAVVMESAWAVTYVIHGESVGSVAAWAALALLGIVVAAATARVGRTVAPGNA